jgi:hypothetical protein
VLVFVKGDPRKATQACGPGLWWVVNRGK